jgi:peptidoglycan hydrolase CwlO-like protein
MKVAAIIIFSLILVSMLFFGCTGSEQKIDSKAAANEALTDVGTDLSGINNSLEDIDNTISGNTTE